MLFRICISQGNRVWIFLSMFVFTLVVIFFEWKLIRLEESKEKLEKTVARLQSVNNLLYKELPDRVTRKNSFDRDTIIVYNRIPKTASTSFVNVAYDLCKRNGFNVLHLNVTGNLHVMSIADQARFVYNVTHWDARKPGLYHGHVAFIDFERFGAIQRPVYINLIRKPLDRLVSYYYFLRYGDNYRPHLIRRKAGDKMTFDDCVRLKQPDCNPDNMWLQIPFMCGHAPGCWEPGNEWALEEAKRNLLNKYLLVGVTEELQDFIALLESALPTFFRGALDHFKNSKKAHLRRTNHKLDPSVETIKSIEKSRIWRMENEFYEFVLYQFRQIKKRMGTDKDGQVFDRGQQFMYEKISPK